MQNPPKHPPHSTEAEQSTLGGIMVNNRALDTIAEFLRPEHFYIASNQLIYQTLLKLSARGREIDFITVCEVLRDTGKLEDAGGMAYIGSVVNDCPSAANVVTYARIVMERAILRQLIESGQTIAELGFRPDGRTNSDLIDLAEQRLSELRDNQKGIGRDLQPMTVFLDAAERTLEKAASGGAVAGLATGFIDLDTKTTGLHPGQMIVIAGRPGMGKTALALTIAEHVAVENKIAAAVFSMEMPGEEVAMRMLGSFARVPVISLRSGRLEDHDWSRLASATGMIREAPLFVDETGSLTPAALRSKARALHKKTPLGLIVVDYIQLMQVPDAENRTNEISECSRAIKSLAKELHIPIIALAQVNRGVEGRDNKRPRLADLRESGSLEQDADVVGFLYRDEVYDEHSKDRGVAELIIAKQRSGPTGTTKLAFHGVYTRFENLAQDCNGDLYGQTSYTPPPKKRGITTAPPAPPYTEPRDDRE